MKAEQFIKRACKQNPTPKTYVTNSDLIGHGPVQYWGGILGIFKVRGEV